MNKTVFIPISDTNQIMVLPNGTMIQHTLTDNQTGAIVVTPDPTSPTLLSTSINMFLDDRGKSSHAISLSNAIVALNARAANHPVYKVEAMYAAKHVTLVGTDKLSAGALMRVLATVYGLRVLQKEDNSLILTRPLTIEAKQLSDLSRALQSAMPAPIFRMFQTRALDKTASLSAYKDSSGAKYRSAMQMFRYIAERTVKAQPGAKILLSQLDERTRRMFAFASTLDAFGRASWLIDHPLPPYITDIDHVTLTGGISHNPDGAERFSLFFSYSNSKTGTVSGQVGFTNAIIP